MTLTDALQAHRQAISYGGRPGVASLHLIESALARPYFGYYETLEEKAAVLLESMVGNHGFVDGNKRTSVIVLNMLIERSGYVLDVPEDEPIDDLVVDVASGRLRFDDLLAWFRPRLKRR